MDDEETRGAAREQRSSRPRKVRAGLGPARRADTPLDVAILQAIRRILRSVEIHSRKLSAEHDVTGPQLVCLLAALDQGTATATSIAHQVHLSPSTVVGVLDRLEAKGLVERRRDLRDRRIVNVQATPRGRALARRAPLPLGDRLAEALQKLDEGERRAIARSLERIVDMMEAREIEAAPMLETGPIGSRRSGTKESRKRKNGDD
jgi:DNA-binding MarR family transcriptional regulator